MLSIGTVTLVALGYVLLLFWVAYFAEEARRRGMSVISNPLVYTLSLTVYCTAWTYYGSVGLAARSGPLFLAVYLGPTLMAFSWWMLVRRMIRITRENNITSIADFIAFRYGNSVRIGALVAVMMLVGLTPYIGLQLQAVSSSFQKITLNLPHTGAPLDFGLIVAVIMGLFGMFFGAGQLGTERREGMVAVVALEGVIKLAAFLCVGIFVTWFMHDGLGDIFTKIGDLDKFSHLLRFTEGNDPLTPSWVALLVLSALASVLLPRQFHMMVVENVSEKHVGPAMWGFPLYLLLINLFVAPIAFAGLLLFNSAARADSFILALPLAQGQPVLALIAFLGGLSAATGMVIVSSLTLSTMFLNNICMPLIIRMKIRNSSIPKTIVNIKRAAILTICLSGYFYYRLVGGQLELVNMGLISFGAAAQLAPALLGGIFWRQATGRGAATGLALGFFVWFYTMMIPALCHAGVLPPAWLTEGPLGLWLIRPNALFGLDGLDIWSHGLFWSAIFNAGSFMLVSTLTRPSRTELEQIARQTYATRRDRGNHSELQLLATHTPAEFEELLSKFISPQKSRRQIRDFLGNRFEWDRPLPDREAIRLGRQVENLIGGIIGPAAASEVVERYLTLKGSKMEELLDVFGSISISLEHSREELENRVRELSLLYEASKLVTGTLDERKASEEVLALLENDFGLANLGVLLYSDGKLKAGGVHGVHPRLIERLTGDMPAQSLIASAITQKRALRSSSSGQEGYLEFLPRFGLTEAGAAPIMNENNVLGVIFVASRGQEKVITDKFLETLEALAGELALSMTNARLFDEVKELNRTLEEKVSERTAELEAAMRNLKQLDKLKSEFLANISHELRTPMNSILGYTSLVLDGVDGPLADEQRRSLERVENNARHLLGVINDLLDLSRIEAGRMRLELAPVDLGVTAMEVCADLDSMATPKKVALECRLVPGSLKVLADETRVREVLINLVGNAIKFTSTGAVNVVTSTASRGGREGVLVDVIDTGPGIPEKELKTIFEAFNQLDGSSTRKHGGAGLGLSIAKKLVEMHGGTLEVNSTMGKGSTFSVWWPREAASEPGSSEIEA